MQSSGLLTLDQRGVCGGASAFKHVVAFYLPPSVRTEFKSTCSCYQTLILVFELSVVPDEVAEAPRDDHVAPELCTLGWRLISASIWFWGTSLNLSASLSTAPPGSAGIRSGFVELNGVRDRAQETCF